jgi:PKD domain
MRSMKLTFFPKQLCMYLMVSLIATVCLDVGASSWSEGKKKLLYMRVDFSDLPGDPLSKDAAAKIMSQVDSFYSQNSYGKLSVVSTITPTLRLPWPAATYEADHVKYNRLNDARKVAKAAGFDPDDYDFDAVAFKRKGPGSTAIGGIGIKGLWLDNTFDYGATVHELGHNLGLLHANLWATWDGSIIGRGHHQDYGDENDVMGCCPDDPRKHTSAPFKAMVGWLSETDITNVAKSGMYRIYAQDLPGQAPSRALKIVRDPENTYWVEFRQLLTENPFLMSGARVLRQYSSTHGMDQLDMTPETPTGNDGALLLGRTFSDTKGGVHITPIRKGNGTPPWLDVQVNLGNFATNHPPKVRSLTAHAQSDSPSQTTELKIEATDPDGDPLQYSWDFGDKTFGWGSEIVSHSWPEMNRDYLVRCVVTDMKGGTSSRLLVVKIGQPATSRLSGLVQDGGHPLANVLVRSGSGEPVLSDSDGKFELIGIKPGKTRVTAQKAGYVFRPVQIECPTSKTLELEPFPVTKEGGIVCPEGITLERNDERLSTTQSYRPPVDIFIVARTDSTNLRLAYAANQVIFNWEGNGNQLRIDGGPADGHHKSGAGAIPKDKDVTIQWVVTPSMQSIYVDGILRFTHTGDYSQIDRPVWVFPYQSKVTVKSIRVKH